jgi:hypothetical protein
MASGPPADPTPQGPPSLPELLRIGWKEYLDFPEWRLRHVRVKVDTGACTSALDVAGYELRPTQDGRTVAHLRLALNRRQPQRLRHVEAAVVGSVVVSSSSGLREERPVIEATIQIGPVVKLIRLTITNRASMRFRMLLGREALRGSFVVDPSEQYLLRPRRS